MIITGVPEENIMSPAPIEGEPIPITTDVGKVNEILRITENNYFNSFTDEQFVVSRIGNPRNGKTRAI